MDEELSIRVNIAERYYSFRVQAKKEENIRKAAKMLNERVLEYQQRVPGKDTQDFVAMVALQNTVKLLEYEQNTQIDRFINTLKDLDTELDNSLV